MLSRGVILLQDNALPHLAQASKNQLQTFGWEILEHPPYSPDLSHCDFHVFGPLKKSLKGRRLASNEEVKDTVEEWFRTQLHSFFTDGIHRLVQEWDNYLNQYGDYV